MGDASAILLYLHFALAPFYGFRFLRHVKTLQLFELITPHSLDNYFTTSICFNSSTIYIRLAISFRLATIYYRPREPQNLRAPRALKILRSKITENKMRSCSTFRTGEVAVSCCVQHVEFSDI